MKENPGRPGRPLQAGGLPHVALPLCLIVAGCGGRRGPVDPDLSVFIPPDAVALAGINVDRVRGTAIYRKLAERHPLPQLGRDVSEVLLVSDGKSVLAIARGDFKEQKTDETEGVVFLNRNIALGGEAAAVRAAIEQSKHGGRGAPRDLIARARALPADTQIWAVVAGWRGSTPDQLREMGNWGNLDRVFRLVEGASLTVDLRTGVHAAFTGDSRTEADARNLADSLRGLAALSGQAGIQVKQEGRVVQVNVDIAEDLAERLVR